MKTTILTVLLFVATSASLQAQNLIAVQNAGTPAFFQQVDSAIIHSQNGDTIYIPGGSWNISIPINKCLHFIGVGNNPDSTRVTSYTQIIGQMILLTGSDGGSIEGISFNEGLSFGSSSANQNVNNYKVSRCFIPIGINLGYQMPSNSSNNIFSENIIGHINGYNSTQNAFYNNFINTLEYFNSNNIFYNNIFFQAGVMCCPTCWYETSTIANVFNSTFRNNIFPWPNNTFPAICSSVTNCFFDNNIFMQNTSSPIAPGSMENNNIFNQPQGSIFVKQSGSGFDYNQDYHLQSSCPGKNAGTDGTDIGIYGGAFPWKEGSVPSNPHFQTVKIAPKTDANGNLNVNIKVQAQDN